MADERPTLPLYEVPYLRLFPWLRLFRVPGGASDPKRLMLAALGLILLQGGWQALDRVFVDSATVTPTVLPSWGVLPPNAADAVSFLVEPFRVVTAPFVALFDPQADARAFTHAGLAALWVTAVWGLIGGAVARIAAVRLARRDRLKMGEALTFAAKKVVPLVGTPLLPMLAVAVVAASVAAFGVLYRVPGFGSSAAGVLAFLPLIGGLLLTLVLIGLGVGWPLMHASVAAEAKDGFDAMSRSYAYVHQRPWHYAAYTAVAAALGAVGLWFVSYFAHLVVRLSAWALGFGGPAATVNGLFGVTAMPDNDPGTQAHTFWLGAVSLLVHAWAYSYFWTAAAAVYLLLRRDVDGTPVHEIAYKARPNLLAEAVAESYPPRHVAEPAGSALSP